MEEENLFIELRRCNEALKSYDIEERKKAYYKAYIYSAQYIIRLILEKEKLWYTN